VLQSSLESQLRDADAVEEIPPEHRHHGVFSHLWPAIDDVVRDGFVVERAARLAAEVVEGTLVRIAEGTHPFNPRPAEQQLADPARLIIVGDWGSGLRPARALAGRMQQEVTAGVAAGREVHVIHLGDVYWAGQADEYRRHVLADGWWPVTAELTERGVRSWSLAGNHDLYGGARPYFTVLLGDARFRLQRSADGAPTSWFRLASPSWQIIGLDSAWNDDPRERGQTGLLQDPQLASLEQWLAQADGRKAILLTHHQFMSVYDGRLTHAPAPPPMVARVKPFVDRGAIHGWLWGHEHRCMAFSDPGLPFPRCIGHGGQLQKAHAPGTRPPSPALWQETAAFRYSGGLWNTFGFAVLDIDGPQITVSYHLDGPQPVVGQEQLP